MQAALYNHVFNKVALSIFRPVADRVRSISSTTRLADLGLGRLGRLKFAIELEALFDLEMPDEVVEQFVTIGDVVDYLSRRHFRDVEKSVIVAAEKYQS